MIKSVMKAFLKAFLFFIFLWVFLALPWTMKFCVIIFVIIWTRKAAWVKQDKISMYFGVPGSGKTTFAAWYVRQAQKKGIPVYSNVPVHGAFKIERSDIGLYMLKDCLIIIDEASLEYNNRDFKNFMKNENYFYSMHRHYCAEVIFFSQGWEDADKRIRTLTQRLFLVKKSLIPYMIARKEIRKCIDIDKETHQVIDGYAFRNWFVGTKYIFSPVLWKYFDSFECKELPAKDFEYWYPEDLPSIPESDMPEPEEAAEE